MHLSSRGRLHFECREMYKKALEMNCKLIKCIWLILLAGHFTLMIIPSNEGEESAVLNLSALWDSD